MSSGGNGMRGFALNSLLRALAARYQSIGAEWVIPSSRLRNGLTTRVPPQRLVLAAFLCLLIAAAALRFYDLTGNFLRYDEAVAANNSRGTFSETVSNTRDRNSSPILYPLALWAVQKVGSTTFSVRVLPAAASVLTVAVMLFLLPRLGVARGAAFLAALLATLSVAAIYHAQDGREYSIDALLAVLMIAGLLWYLRDGRKALLCASLFLAPLLQYGLVLFGAAVMGVAMLLPTPEFGAPEGKSYPGRRRRRGRRRGRIGAPEGNSYLRRVRNWIKPRIALLWPAACFLAGCVISYAATLRYQWQEGGWTSGGWLLTYYYKEKFDASAIFEFSIDGIWNLLTYHLTAAVAIAALTAFAILLAAAVLREFLGKFPDSAIAVLFSLCIAASVAAALLSIYPLEDIRQAIYLGPIIFLATAVAFHWIAGSLAALTRRGWLAPALTISAVGALALAGVSAMRQDSPYTTDEDIKSVLAVLQERVREEDIVYVDPAVIPAMRFYQGKEESPANYYYGTHWCPNFAELCLGEMANIILASLPNVPNRIFVAYQSRTTWPTVSGWTETTTSGEKNGGTHRVQTEAADPIRTALFELLGEQVSVEVILTDGIFSIAMITYPKESFELAVRSFYQALLSGEPIIRSYFDVYLSESVLAYVREPCARADTEAKFFVHILPVDANDLPDHRIQYGFDNLDFSFERRGVISDGRCIATAALPYEIIHVRTGQYDASGALWEGEIGLEQ